MVVATPFTSSSVSVNQARFRFCSGGGIAARSSAEKFRAASGATAPGCEKRRCKARARRGSARSRSAPACFRSRFRCVICWTNFSKRRNASCSQTRFAIRKVRRSGSVTPSISSRQHAPSLPAARNGSESSFQSETFAGLASSKIFPDITPCAMKVAFSRSVNSVGSRPSMKRENICLEQRRARPELLREAILDETGERVVKTVRKARGVPPSPCAVQSPSRTCCEKFRRRSWPSAFR